MYDVGSIMFDLIFVTFGNEINLGLSRELVGDELLIIAFDVINLFNDMDTRKIS